MVRVGLSIVGVGLVLLLILYFMGGLNTWDPTPAMTNTLLASMLAILVGGLLTLIGMVRLAIARIRRRRGDEPMPRVTPL